ncbi:MAG: malto-oligosyltrehalose synthase, partial [Phycisphaeraceae bacterium]|nr:malto-oligosyltrehalose synthase [Phycisphaeraceae bacterium]
HSTWTDPHKAYETACLAFVERLWDRNDNQAFWDDFLPFQAEIAHYGGLNSLSQSLLKMTCPGIPDFYQGTELWDFNLVDPDNRGPVDFHHRQQVLDELASGSSVDWTEDLLTRPEDGRGKLFLTHKTLQVRAQYAALFQRGGYSPVTVQGTWADHVIAFVRHDKEARALVVVPRWLTSLAPGNTWPLGQAIWKDTVLQLPGNSHTAWRNALTGATLDGHPALSLGQILQQCPVALLLSPNR